LPAFWSRSLVVLNQIGRVLWWVFFLGELRWLELLEKAVAAGISANKVEFVFPESWWRPLMLLLLLAGRGGEEEERSIGGLAYFLGRWGSSTTSHRCGVVWSTSRLSDVLHRWELLVFALKPCPWFNKHLHHPCSLSSGVLLVSLLLAGCGGEEGDGYLVAAAWARQVNQLLQGAHHMVDIDVAMIHGREDRRSNRCVVSVSSTSWMEALV